MKASVVTKWSCVVMSLLWMYLSVGTAKGQIANTLYSFAATGDGRDPYGGPIMDAAGNLYGITQIGGPQNAGTAFELVNSGGSYTEKVLYNFTGTSGDGANPFGSLVMDGSGNLYGTTSNGGTNGAGTVFELVNASGTYTEKVLYSFGNYGSGDGRNPTGDLIFDAAGNLYGTANSGGSSNSYGAVFELVNSSGTYTEKVLYSFTNSNGDGAYPQSAVLMDASGNLFGTTFSGGMGYGTVFELVNSSGSYSEQILYSFNGKNGDGYYPLAGLVMDGSGNLYGTTQNGGPLNTGTVFELVNSGGTYTESILYSFQTSIGDGYYPGYGSLLMDASGNLYGTTIQGTSGSGTVYELVNSSGSYSEKLLVDFGTICGKSQTNIYDGLAMDSSGNLYGTTYNGGTNSTGSVFSVTHLSGGGFSTTTTLTSSANPINAGDPVSFTATVTSAGGTPTGSVTFYEGATVLKTQSLSCGTSSVAVSDAEALGIGSSTITAQYTPTGSAFLGSTGSMVQTVQEAGVAVTNGNNTLNGNQTIDGSVSASSVSASSFTGNGSGLTNVSASGVTCAFCIGNSQLAINYAGSSSQGGPASNSLLFGGLLPSAFQLAGSYATTGANLFTGDQSVTGNVSVTGNSSTAGTTTMGASGTPIVQHLSATFTPTFNLHANSSCSSQNFSLTGAASGNTVALGIPNSRMTSANLFYTAWVSAANTVTIRACVLGTKPLNLGTGAIRVDVWQH